MHYASELAKKKKKKKQLDMQARNDNLSYYLTLPVIALPQIYYLEQLWQQDKRLTDFFFTCNKYFL